MRAIKFDGKLKLVDTAKPEPGPNEALIRVALAGICNTDIEITRGYMDFKGIPGHEFVGEVIACNQSGWENRRVVGEINLGCGRCSQCRMGLQRHCPDRTVLGILNKDGAMAEYLTLPLANLHAVPDELPDEAAVFAEPLAAAFEIPEQVHLQPGIDALVIGDGKLALLVVQVLRKYGAEVTVLGRHENKLQVAQAFGAGTTLVPSDLRPRYDLVVEASGGAEAMALAVAKTRPRGTLILKSTYAGAVSLQAAPIVIDEITMVGSRCGPFAPAIKSLAAREIDVAPLVSGIFPLQQALQAFDYAQQPGILKVLLKMH